MGQWFSLVMIKISRLQNAGTGGNGRFLKKAPQKLLKGMRQDMAGAPWIKTHRLEGHKEIRGCHAGSPFIAVSF